MLKKKKKTSEIFVSVRQMKDIDRITSEKYGIASLILMENAGKAVASEAEKVLGKLKNKKIAVVCGSGNNAGDGFAAARYLINGGREVKIVLAKKTDSFKGDCGINFEILKNLKADISFEKRHIGKAGLIIDAVVGTGLNGCIEGKTAGIINEINASRAYKISADIPSGLDGDSGEVMGCAVKSDKTVTFAFAKNAYKNRQTKQYTGKIIISDIGIPKMAIKDILKNEKN